MNPEGVRTAIHIELSRAVGSEPIEDLIEKGNTFYAIINYKHGLPARGFVNYDHALNEARRMSTAHPGHQFHVVKHLSVSYSAAVTTKQLHPA